MKRRDFILGTGVGAVGASIVRSRPLNAQGAQWQSDGAGAVARFGVLTPEQRDGAAAQPCLPSQQLPKCT